MRSHCCLENTPRLRAESQQKMAVLQNSDVPQWYVDSMCKIYYLFPKANAPHPCGGAPHLHPRGGCNAPHPYGGCTPPQAILLNLRIIPISQALLSQDSKASFYAQNLMGFSRKHFPQTGFTQPCLATLRKVLGRRLVGTPSAKKLVVVSN